MVQINWEAASHCQQALNQAGLNIPLLKDDAPVFNEPWQAQAFAITLALHNRGLFTWPQWAQTLSECIQSAQGQGDPDRGSTYYHHWLSAIEQITTSLGLVCGEQLDARQAAWRAAAARTPHGQPIELSGAEQALPEHPKQA
jgi:nitrile hydratase accessory protein